MKGEERGIWLEKQEECSSHPNTHCYHPGGTDPAELILHCTGWTGIHKLTNMRWCLSCHISSHPLLCSAVQPLSSLSPLRSLSLVLLCHCVTHRQTPKETQSSQSCKSPHKCCAGWVIGNVTCHRCVLSVQYFLTSLPATEGARAAAARDESDSREQERW